MLFLVLKWALEKYAILIVLDMYNLIWITWTDVDMSNMDPNTNLDHTHPTKFRRMAWRGSANGPLHFPHNSKARGKLDETLWATACCQCNGGRTYKGPVSCLLVTVKYWRMLLWLGRRWIYVPEPIFCKWPGVLLLCSEQLMTRLWRSVYITLLSLMLPHPKHDNTTAKGQE